MNLTSLSFVIPFFNEKGSLPELIEQLYHAMRDPELHRLFDGSFSFEIILVDDGSTDGSSELARSMIADRPELRLISFQRNFGKTAALTAGFRAAQGSVVCTLDADLQDDPASIRPLVAKLFEGYDLVSGWKKERKDPPGKTVPSRLFNVVTRLFTGIPIHDFNCGLKVYRREVTDRIELHGEMHRYIPVLAGWNGFRITELPVNHRPRKFGSTKFGTGRFFAGLFDFLAVLFITRYFRRPMHFFGMAGLVSFLSGFTISLYVTLDKLLNHKPVSNRPILFLGILLIILGAQLFSTGLLGEMLSTSAPGANQFTIRETYNLSEKQADEVRRQ
ncbi:glycosyl transferase family 2 [Chlorobium limicola DSM 245]|uniref:Glycosyl transferase family 2 n=1 Tax=Chlorobium limicola (strain DSM 245 / NBRC 103803 / 6330) TaxID=290315 RepID=B3EEJ6_CHLL2|nr:glycosyl transferase family 2 [Chlorobium limicola DSM 245]